MILAMPVLAIGKIFLKYKFGINFEIEDENPKEKKNKSKKILKKQNKEV